MHLEKYSLPFTKYNSVYIIMYAIAKNYTSGSADDVGVDSSHCRKDSTQAVWTKNLKTLNSDVKFCYYGLN